MASLLLLLLSLLTFGMHHGECALKLSTYFGDHMVLQRGPQQAVLWGTADTEGDTVTAKVVGQGSDSTSASTTVVSGNWKLKLPAQTAKGPFTIDVSSKDGHVMLNDLLFGDVWLCSGQSNMYFRMRQVMNASEELHKAARFSSIRFTKAAQVQSPVPLSSMAFDFPWSTPDSVSLSEFSAVCFLFGEYLQQSVNVPIGLVESAWGSTRIEVWSDPQAIKNCSGTNTKRKGPQENSVLWNAMIHPLLSATITGALWYQGESNSGAPEKYSCQIQAMLREWRALFHSESLQQTSSDFPFGYVQLSAYNKGDDVGGFPAERWAQTANYGYSPNPALPNTFMAVAMDLPDYESRYGAIHPRYKQDVAQRLVLGALHVAYGQKDLTFQGPFPTGFKEGHHTLGIFYNHGHVTLTVKNNKGFEVCCSPHHTTHCDDRHDTWVSAPITAHHTSYVSIDTSGCGTRHVVGVRYEWRTSPCEFKECSLYDSVSGLPAPPYVSHDLRVNRGPEIIG